MKICLQALLVHATMIVASAQTIWFSDDFRRTELGDAWSPATGSWEIRDSVLRIQTDAHDVLLASSTYLYDTQPFSIVIILRGNRAGLYFNLDGKTSTNFSHMVRFEGRSVLSGFLSGSGEFKATKSMDAKQPPVEWTTLRVEVNPPKKRYEIFVDGKSLGTDTVYRFTSGYFGLHASAGLSEFRSVRVFSQRPPAPPRQQSRGSPVAFHHVAYVRSDGKALTVYDPELQLLQSIDVNGKIQDQEPFSTAPFPVTGVSIGERTYAIEGERILVRNTRNEVVGSIRDHLISPTTILSNADRVRSDSTYLYVCDPGANAVLQFDLSGRFVKSFTAAAIGGFIAPRDIDFHGEDQIVVADYSRLVFINRSLEEVKPVVRLTSVAQATISWPRVSEAASVLHYSSDGGEWVKLNSTRTREGMNSVILTNLKPLTRYSYIIRPVLKTLPASDGVSDVHRFSTPPISRSMMAFTRLRIMIMVYQTTSFRDVYPASSHPEIPSGHTLSLKDIVSLKEANELCSVFYFRNSGCKIVLDFDSYVVEDTLWLSEVGTSGPHWLSPTHRVTRDFEMASKFFKRRPEDYVGLVVPYAWVNHPPRQSRAMPDPKKTDVIIIRQAEGKGTLGIPAPWKFGVTTGYSSYPVHNRFSRPDWLLTHAVHHQIYDLMRTSGYPEYCRPDQPWKMAGRFGADFDFAAKGIRNAPLENWANLKWGSLHQTRDADGDGVPDDDISLPFDEKRLGGYPDSPDSDGDGLHDLAEVMAGSSRGSLLNNIDTDGDAIIDGIDPEPLYTTIPAITKLEMGGLPMTKATFFARLDAGELRASIFMSWSDSTLSIGYLANKGYNLLLQIDANNDGWFHGLDNFQIRIHAMGDSGHVQDFYIRDCTSWTEPPIERRELLRVQDLQVRKTRSYKSIETEAGFTVEEVHLLKAQMPAYKNYGLDLRKGKKISLRIGLQAVEDPWVWHEVFERNYMMTVELQ